MMSWITIDFFDKGIEQARLTEFVLLRYRKIHIGIDVIWWGRALFSKYTEWTLKSELIGGDCHILNIGLFIHHSIHKCYALVVFYSIVLSYTRMKWVPLLLPLYVNEDLHVLSMRLSKNRCMYAFSSFEWFATTKERSR